MKVLVTGAAGFLGTRLIKALLAGDGHGPAVTRIVAADTVPCPIVDPRVDSRSGTIVNPDFIRAIVEPDVDAVFHLAAVLSGQSEAEFDVGMRVNLDATRALLEACRALGRPVRFVFSSTVAVFGADLPDVVPEDSVLQPQSSYGTAKAMTELLVREYSRRGFALLYFGGHGFSTADGLILAFNDFSSEFAFDTGVPLSRVLQILAGAEAKTFAVIVDACRSAAGVAKADAIPANVAVIYAAQHGQVATERNGRSDFVEAFLASMPEIKPLLGHLSLVVSLSDVIDQIPYVGISVGAAVVPDRVGRDMRDFCVPACAASMLPGITGPEVFLDTRPLSAEGASATRDRVEKCLSAWLGFPVSQIQFQPAVLTGGTMQNPILTLRVPHSHRKFAAVEFMQFLLTHCYSSFVSLRLAWPQAIVAAIFRVLSKQVAADLTQLSDSESLLKWAEGGRVGQVRIISRESGATAEVSVRSLEGDRLPLDLLPRFSEIYLRLMAIPCLEK